MPQAAINSDVEAGARALARLQIERNAALNIRAMDEAEINRCIDHAWRDWTEEARRVLEAASTRATATAASQARPVIKAPVARIASRHDLDRMAEAIHALPGVPTMGRAIGGGR